MNVAGKAVAVEFEGCSEYGVYRLTSSTIAYMLVALRTPSQNLYLSPVTIIAQDTQLQTYISLSWMFAATSHIKVGITIANSAKLQPHLNTIHYVTNAGVSSD
jgi:hypothetical protein